MVSRQDRKRKRDAAKRRRLNYDDWSDDIEEEEDAKIRETWAFQRLETFQKEEFPNGFPPDIDVNAIFHELHRSQFSSPDKHIITVLWRENEEKIRAFGEAISRSESWRDVVEGPAPLKIPAIGGADEIMALDVLCHGSQMDRWLCKLWRSMRLDWVVCPDSPQPRFWAGVELSRGSEYQEPWAQGKERRVECDIASLLAEATRKKPRNSRKARGRTPKRGPVGSDSDDEPLVRGHRPRRIPVDSESPVDSDDEPLVGRKVRKPQPKSEKVAVVVQLLQEIDRKIDQERTENMSSKAEIERKLNQLEEDVKQGQEVAEDQEAQIEDLKASLHSIMGRMEVMGDSLINLQQSLNKVRMPSSSRHETSYNTPAKTPAKGNADATDAGTWQEGVEPWAPKDSTLPWKVPPIPIPGQRSHRDRQSSASTSTLE